MSKRRKKKKPSKLTANVVLATIYIVLAILDKLLEILKKLLS